MGAGHARSSREARGTGPAAVPGRRRAFGRCARRQADGRAQRDAAGRHRLCRCRRRRAWRRRGWCSLFPMADVAVMGPLSILQRLPRIVQRVYRTVDAALAFEPDVVVIIDAPEFTHPIARRIRQRMPKFRSSTTCSPSVWAWRPGRAKRMRALRRSRHGAAAVRAGGAPASSAGPPCTYIGHPMIERLDVDRRARSRAAGGAAGPRRRASRCWWCCPAAAPRRCRG